MSPPLTYSAAGLASLAFLAAPLSLQAAGALAGLAGVLLCVAFLRPPRNQNHKDKP